MEVLRKRVGTDPITSWMINALVSYMCIGYTRDMKSAVFIVGRFVHFTQRYAMRSYAQPPLLHRTADLIRWSGISLP